MFKNLLKFTFTLLLLVTSSFSLAQAALEEMVVTSQKRAQNLLDVPSALQAFSGEMLEAAGVRDTDDLATMIPDMMMSGEDAGRANIWLRGIGSTKFDIGSEGSNAFFVDEVYMARGQSILSGLVDIERIEVLKGPQGTLYGRNALGGAISVFYKKPSSEFEQKIKVGGGNNGQENFSYMVSGQLATDLYGRMALSYQDDDGAHRDNTFPGDIGPSNENIRFSLFGEGSDYEWSFTADSSVSKEDAMVSEAIICKRDDTTCTAAQRNLIQPNLFATASGLDIFVTDFSRSTAYAASGGDAAALAEIRSDKYSSNLSEDTAGERTDIMLSGKFKTFQDNYDLTLLVSTNQNQGFELKDFDSTKAKSFVQGMDQKTNQSSIELRWNSKPEDEIQWVAGVYSFLDYGERTDIFRTGPDSVFNQAAVAAAAYIDVGMFNVANLSALASAASYVPTASKTALVNTVTTARATSLTGYGTAGLDLDINNKSSAAFGQVTIPMADQWNITLGARYSYDTKGMTYTTSSNSVGVPHALVLPGCTPNTVNQDGTIGCSTFNAADASTLYTTAQKQGQFAVVTGAYAGAPSFIGGLPGWQTTCQAATDAANIGSAACNANFTILANAQGVGIAPIASVQQVFTVNKQASWSSTDPKVTIDYKPTESSMLWYTYATGFKSGGWQFANYFKELVEQGFDPEELEMNEIGYKGSFLNDSLSVSAVAYAYDWTDKQVIKVSVVQGLPVGITQNAGSSKINGLDLNLRASVADQTIINFNYAYIDAAYDVFCDDSRDWTDVHGSFTSCDSTKVGAYNRSGGKMPWTPDNAMVLSVEHVEPTTIGDVIINTSYSYKTNVGNADERVAGLTFLDEIARLNFSTTIEFNNGTSLRGFCTNCLDVDDDIGFTLIYPGGQGGGARVKYYDGMRAGLEVVHQF